MGRTALMKGSGEIIFCDDVRQETTGKFIIVGVYIDSIILAAPIDPLYLAIVLRLRGLEQGQHRVTLRFSLDERVIQEKDNFPFLASPKGRGFVVLGGVPVDTKKGGLLRLEAIIDGGDVLVSDEIMILRAQGAAPTPAGGS